MKPVRHHVCEIFAFELYSDLETGGWGHSRSSKVPPFDSLVWFSIRFYSNYGRILYRFPRYTYLLVKNHPIFSSPLYSVPPLGVKPLELSSNLWWRKARIMGLSGSKRFWMKSSTVLIPKHVCDTQTHTDGNAVTYTCASIASRG